MNDNKFFDEETVEKVREYEKSERALNEEKKKFEQIHKQEIMAEAANNNISNEDLLKIYIGKNYNKIAGKSFNWSAFFFGSLYAFFRKMYVFGFLLMIFQSTISIYVSNSILNTKGNVSMMFMGALSSLSFIVNLVVGFSFNGMYLNKSVNKINNIKETNKDRDRIIELCKKKGGTNIILAFILSLALSGIATAIATFISTIAK